MNILDYKLGMHEVRLYVYGFLMFLSIFILFKVFKTLILKRLEKLSEKTDNDLDDLLIKMINDIPNVFYYVVAIYFPLSLFLSEGKMQTYIHSFFIVILAFQGIRSLSALSSYSLEKYMTNGKSDEQGKTAFHGINLIVKLSIWVIGFLLIMSNLGFDVTSLIASLGIGGIAVALAAQNILADMFSSFSLYFDKPFEVGDFVTIGTDSGTVKKIGLKTTRIKTPQGQELIIANKELTNARVQNFRKLKKRRVVFSFGLKYGTSSKKLKNAENIVKKIIESHKLLEFSRVHFSEFSAYSLNFECVYFVLSSKYDEYMDAKQDMNFAVLEAFEKEGIEMAYPTQTVIVEK